MLEVKDCKNMFSYVSKCVVESEPELTRIDSQIGDGDHGTGMEEGFLAVHKMLEKREFDTINELFRAIGLTLIKSMGGASGVIFGTMFFSGDKEAKPTTMLDSYFLAHHFSQSLEAIKKRGRADVGDKTMIDALEPAVVKMKKYQDKSITETMKAVVDAAEEGVENTKKYRARFGRARKFGDKAIGIQDAGATSVSIIFRSMYEWIENNEREKEGE